MSNKLFVGNLSFNTTENDLQEAFAAHGTVVETNLMMDRMTGRSRGFAFVTMSSAEEAQKAISAMNGATLGDRQLTVNIARPKEERPRGGRLIEMERLRVELGGEGLDLVRRHTRRAARVPPPRFEVLEVDVGHGSPLSSDRKP